MSTDSSRSRYYITTSIPYVNAAPHIGHALEFVQTDAFARYHRLVGDDTRFLTGTDENSLTNVLTAEQEGIPVADLVERNAATFLALTEFLHISNQVVDVERHTPAPMPERCGEVDRAGGATREPARQRPRTEDPRANSEGEAKVPQA